MPMMACDSPRCPIEWFYFSYVGITEEPKGKRYCDSCASKQNVQDSSTTVRKQKTARNTEGKKGSKMICSCGSNIHAHKRGCPLNPSYKGKEEQAKPNPETAPDVQIIGQNSGNLVIVSGPIPTQEWKADAVAALESWSKCKINVLVEFGRHTIPYLGINSA